MSLALSNIVSSSALTVLTAKGEAVELLNIVPSAIKPAIDSKPRAVEACPKEKDS